MATYENAPDPTDIENTRIGDIWSNLPADHPLRNTTVGEMMDGTAVEILAINAGYYAQKEEGTN